MNHCKIGRLRFWALCLALLLTALPLAQAETSDGFFSDAGVFSYLRRPGRLPARDPYPCNGWLGLFYAEGTGLEVQIRGESADAAGFLCDLYSYNASDPSSKIDAIWVDRMADGSLRDPNGAIVLHDLQDGSFTMEFSPDYLAQKVEHGHDLIYGSPSSARFTAASVLAAHAEEDRWGGAYFYDVMTDIGGVEVYDDLTIYISLVQIYGTHDYYCVVQREHYGQEMDGMVGEFLLEEGDRLIHDYGTSIVTGENYTVHYWLDDARTLYCDAGDDGTIGEYRRCSIKPMWGE